MWNVSDMAPFSFGDLTWTVRVIPLNGGDVINQSEYTVRSRSIQPLLLSLIQTLLGDHRLASPSQTVQFQILDPVLLPSDVHVMLWREWADDIDLNGWPSPDEYKERSLIIPTDLTQSTGLYTLLFDDSMGSQVRKLLAIWLVWMHLVRCSKMEVLVRMVSIFSCTKSTRMGHRIVSNSHVVDRRRKTMAASEPVLHPSRRYERTKWSLRFDHG